MHLRRKKPFLLLATIISIILLVLICVTSGNTCYNQNSYEFYQKYASDNGGSNACDNLCNGTPAVKKISNPANGQLVNGEYPLPFPQSPFDTNNTRRYVRCGWLGTTKRIFFAAACVMVLLAFIELFLTCYRKWLLALNIFYLFTVGMSIVAAIYIIRDIHRSDCDNIINNNDGANGTVVSCNRSIFVVSFILMIVAIVLWAAQFIYNCLYRKRMNEEDPKYANIPQTQAHAPKATTGKKGKKGAAAAAVPVADQAVVDNRIQ